MLKQRILTGIVAIPLLIAAAFDDGWIFRIVIFATGLVGTGEALWMARQAAYRPVQPFAYLLAACVLADPALWPGRLIGPALGVAALGALAVCVFNAEQEGKVREHALADWALTLALPLYVAGLLQFYILLRLRDDGGTISWPLALPLTWPAMVMATSWACDSVAFFVGRAFGRLRLAPLISPKKSVEGALAGIIAAMMAGALFSLWNGLHPFVMAGFGGAVGVGSVVGDLAESLLKRLCGVKDSGVIMPGHGGILDRMDALIASAACAYFYLEAVL